MNEFDLAGTHLLIVDDDIQFTATVSKLLEQEGIEVDSAQNTEEAFEKLFQTQIDVMLLDLALGEESGLAILRDLNSSGSAIPVIVMTAHASMEVVMEALRTNAFDFIRKPFERDEIREVLQRAVAVSRKGAASSHGHTTGKTIPIIGQSPSMVEVYKAIARVSQTDSTVLITGESGTGKELVARAIHENSARSKRPFYAINCGALADTLLESELFGHMKGAFTGAHTAHSGVFESANGGTVFLDEISETSPAFQVKLLRVLQQRMIRPVGSTEEKPIDVRVLAATNHTIKTLLASSFRKDLFYRLSVIHISIPPLRERTEDVPLLVQHFLRRFSKRQNKSVVMPGDTIEWMKTLPWPGNVRELENAIERAVTMKASGEILPHDLVPFAIQQSNAELALDPLNVSSRTDNMHFDTQAGDVTPLSLNELIRRHVIEVLKFTSGNKLRTAEILGIGRYTLYRMLQRFAIDTDSLGELLVLKRKKNRGAT